MLPGRVLILAAVGACGAENGVYRVGREGGSAGGPVRVVLEIQRLAAGAEELEQVEVFNALGLQRLGQALGVRGRAGAGEFRHVFRVE